MDKERLPRWGWLVIGLFAVSIVAQIVNQFILHPIGLPAVYQSITVITLMAPVLIYVGVWYDAERQHYWDQSQEHILGDVLFVVAGAALGSAIALMAIVNAGLPQMLQDIVAMAVGFMISWGLFWWRNPGVYREESVS